MAAGSTHRDNASCLDEHVIYGSRYSPSPHAVGIGRCPCYLNWVHVGEARDQSHDDIVDPLRRALVELVQSNEQWQCPELQDDRGANARIKHFAQVAGDEEPDDAENSRRDGEQVRLSRIEPKVAEGQGKVGLRGIYRD